MRKTAAAALLPLALILTAASPPELTRWRAEASHVTIIRDDWGIAHVRGKTDADAVFGMIYAQAKTDFPRSEANYSPNFGAPPQPNARKRTWKIFLEGLYVTSNNSKAGNCC